MEYVFLIRPRLVVLKHPFQALRIRGKCRPPVMMLTII
jgi:hypothetical protein